MHDFHVAGMSVKLLSFLHPTNWIGSTMAKIVLFTEDKILNNSFARELFHFLKKNLCKVGAMLQEAGSRYFLFLVGHPQSRSNSQGNFKLV